MDPVAFGTLGDQALLRQRAPIAKSPRPLCLDWPVLRPGCTVPVPGEFILTLPLVFGISRDNAAAQR
jgi:hypothetical protein